MRKAILTLVLAAMTKKVYVLLLLIVLTVFGVAQTKHSGKITTSGKVAVSGTCASPCGPLSPGTVTTSNVLSVDMVTDWVNPNNAKVSDDVYATATSITADKTSYYLYGSSFGFAIPANATIDGILVEVEAKQTAGNSNNTYANLIVNGVMNDVYEIGTGGLSETETYLTAGGASSLWDTVGLTPAQVNASSFGVGWFAYCNVGPCTAAVDHVRMTIYFH